METLPGFNYVPFTKDDLVQSMLKRKESGECPVQDPKFYEPWDMVEVGTEEYELRTKLPREILLKRREMKKMMNKKRK